MLNIRTDLALENNEIYKKINKKEAEGVKIYEKFVEDDIKITCIEILNLEGSTKIGKEVGSYITVEIPEETLYNPDLMESVSVACGEELRNLLGEVDGTVLVVGLGNWRVTPDSLGPRVVEKIMITRHLKKLMPESIDEDIKSVCAITPGVLGITGIETAEIIKGMVDKIKPELIICIDSLAARKVDRVNRTIQISDTGISPGSGVGNSRMKINFENLGVRVVAIGVPTVVHASTIVNDSIDLVLEDLIKLSKKGGEFYNLVKEIDKEEKSKLIKELLNPYLGELIVTPKEVDLVIDSLSKIISSSINLGIQKDLDIEDINRLIN